MLIICVQRGMRAMSCLQKNLEIYTNVMFGERICTGYLCGTNVWGTLGNFGLIKWSNHQQIWKNHLIIYQHSYILLETFYANILYKYLNIMSSKYLLRICPLVSAWSDTELYIKYFKENINSTDMDISNP